MNMLKDENIATGLSSASKETMLSGFAAFTQLITALGNSTKTNDKIEALVDYFSVAADEDKIWTIAIFTGRRPKRPVNSTLLSQWAVELSNLEWWLFEECYHVVGDLAETIALLLPDWPEAVANRHQKSLHYYLEQLIALANWPDEKKKDFILSSWKEMTREERFVFNKFFTGGFRIGVSQSIIVKALSNVFQLSPSIIAHRLSGAWQPATTSFKNLFEEDAQRPDWSKPYPFYLAYALEQEAADLGSPTDWQAEWKWDGIRGEIIKRNNELFVWSRGEELVTDKFPEYQTLLNKLPEGVALDGEIICGHIEENKITVLPFALLQTRIGRKNVTRKQLKEAPVIFIAYDLLEYDGEDWRNKPLRERRAKLETIIGHVQDAALVASPVIDFTGWKDLEEKREMSRDLNAEGIMLKQKDSIYQVGRKRGDWWKWKIDPLTIDCVMIYAQKGAGRRSNLYTAYTFAVRDGEQLVPFTRAYSGLTDKEIGQVDAFVKRNAIEKFGPVRTVKPELVFEIAFEGIAASNRHKSGVALRFPRISRWRKDKSASEINTLNDLKQLLQVYGNKSTALADEDDAQ